MKQLLIPALVLCFAVFLVACTAGGKKDSQESQSYHKITPEEGKKRMDEGGVTVVDVRTEEEYKEGHVPGAILVPNETITDTAPQKLSDKTAPLILYCRSGVRSKQASDKLIALGYENIYDMGGILDWTYETESGEEL